ncbi:hypothetical protein JHK82_022938 [Glycine max]|nr:hypothetical protein JHK82_022938 [Glycine max]
MASSSSFSFIPQETDDVFISFRGEDTRHSFTAHLLAALGRLKIRTYVDYKLGRGDEISPTLLRPIVESKVSVIVLSRNYICHFEVVLGRARENYGMQKNKGSNHPSDVRNQTGSYADAFVKHEQRLKDNVQKVELWRDSLREVANLSGLDCLVNSNLEERHEVFLSFRGEDTRKTFTSHLHAAFKRMEINTYIDYNLERGDEISGTLLRAIEDAKLSVIVFSKNFGTSKWCLDEVKKIMECKKTRRQMVVPVFYDIEPTHVRNQTGSFASAFARHEERFMDRPNKVQKWKDALREATNLSGWDCSVDR